MFLVVEKRRRRSMGEWHTTLCNIEQHHHINRDHQIFCFLRAFDSEVNHIMYPRSWPRIHSLVAVQTPSCRICSLVSTSSITSLISSFPVSVGPHLFVGLASNELFHTHWSHSPNNFRTLFMTLSFSGSYGCSLLGISSTLGKASLYRSTLSRIRSATCF